VVRTLVGVCRITGRKVQVQPSHQGGGPDTAMRLEPSSNLKLPEECYCLHAEGEGRKCTEEFGPEMLSSIHVSAPRLPDMSDCAQSLHLCCHVPSCKPVLRFRWVFPYKNSLTNNLEGLSISAGMEQNYLNDKKKMRMRGFGIQSQFWLSY